MIEQLTGLPENACGFKMSGKLHDADYQTFVPAIDAAIAQHGKVRLLAQFHDFHGCDMRVGLIVCVGLLYAAGLRLDHRNLSSYTAKQ